MNKIAIYCRVDCGSNPKYLIRAIEEQKARLKQFAAAKNYIVAGYYEDAGCPGCDITRPGLQALNEDYNKGLFDAVLVANYSRLYRGDTCNQPNWPFAVIALNES